MIQKFGEYEGVEVDEIPLEYLEWLLPRIKCDELRRAVEDSLQKRLAAKAQLIGQLALDMQVLDAPENSPRTRIFRGNKRRLVTPTR